ncbi:MAG: transposase [Armatimonadetes bacterium]|nr:transposase [Armatimonadota bacterium]
METLAAFNAACNYLGEIAFRLKTANKYRLQQEAYHDVRDRFGLSSQMAVRAIAKTCEAYKRDRMIRPTFRHHGAMVYDERIMAWKSADTVSLLTLSGRIVVPVRYSSYQAARLDRRQGQADLVYRDGTFYLYVTVDVPEADPFDPEGFLGVDLGMVNIATDSDGTQHSGAVVNGLRHRHRRLRKRLQAKGTKSSRRLLKQRRRKESRFARHTNHVIGKQIVANAKDTKRAIALEDLQGIRDRCTVRKAQRATFSSWSLFQLRSFIAYKAQREGVPVVYVDPRNTSRTCPICGHVDKRNRPTQSRFLCTSCGFAGLADVIAAGNISRRAALSQPYASEIAPAIVPGAKSHTL